MIKTHKYTLLLLTFLISSLLLPTEGLSAWIWTPKTGRFINEKSIPKGTPKKQFDFAKSYEEKKDHNAAIREYKKLIKAFPTSSLAVYSQIAIAENLEKSRDYYGAFKEYQKVLEIYPSYGRIFDIIERQFKIGNLFLAGGKRRLWKFNIVPANDKAIEVFETVIENAPFSEFSPRSQFLLGECYFKVKKYQDAILEYQKVVEEYSDSEYLDDARFQIGICAYQLSRGSAYDQQATNKAIDTFRSYIIDFTQSRRVAEAKKMIKELEARKAQGAFDVAQYYQDQKQYESAKIYFEEVIKNYPDTDFAQQSRKLLSELGPFLKKETLQASVETQQVIEE